MCSTSSSCNLSERLFGTVKDNSEDIQLSLSGNNDIQIMNLVNDGYLEYVRALTQGFSVGIDPDKIYTLTPKGRDRR